MRSSPTASASRSTCGTENVIALSNLALVTGHVGAGGRGDQPVARPEQRAGCVRHGRAARRPVGHQRVDDDVARGRLSAPGAVRCPRTPASAPAMQRAAGDGALRCMLVIGEDPVVTDAAQHEVRRALGFASTR